MLLALLTGSITLWSALPLSEPSNESNRSLAFGFSAPWHFTQDFSKMGLMSVA
jgi:hypothetical protein